MIDSILSKFLSALAASAMAGLPVAAQAQDAAAQEEAQPQAAPNPYGIPREAVMFEQQDPNVRSATAKVNGAIVTETDVNQRVALVLASSERTELAPAEMQQLRMQVLRNLIDETLQIQAAAAQDMPVAQQEVDQRYLGLAQQNFPQDPKQMDRYLAQVGSSASALKRQIEGELAWSNLLRRNVVPFINVSADEVNETIERMKASRGQYEYRIAEIYLSATPETAGAVQDNAARIMEQIQEGGSFQAYARQFSEASTAAVGGDLGWIRPAQLPSELAQAAAEMQVGQIAGPIETVGGVSIIYVMDKRKVLTADPRDALLSLKQLSVLFPKGTTKEQAGAKAAEFAAAVKEIKGCGQANEIGARIGADVVDNDNVKVRDLPPQLQEILLNLQVGETTPPFGSIEDGVRVLIVCGRDDPASANAPNADQIMAQLEEERVNKRARIYLRDLRRDAVIDYN